MVSITDDDDKPEKVVVEKHSADCIESIGVILFDSQDREHQVWFKNMNSELELIEHRAPTRRMSGEDVDDYEAMRKNAEDFVSSRSVYPDIESVDEE